MTDQPTPTKSTPPASGAAPAIDDPDGVLERMANHAPLLQQIIDIFNQECPALLATVRRSAEAGEPEPMGKAAHRLVGSLGNFNAMRAVKAARQLDEMGRAGRVDGAVALAAELEDAVAAMQVELPALLDRCRRAGG
ncbi:MAG: Hpt domain-containing protein [Planctomycetia bacterium]